MSANENHVTSVETASEIPLPSNVDPPEPAPREAIVHIGASNRLDPQIYQQNIHKTTLTWSTNDQPGHLLWFTPLSPRDINPIVSHMADCYHVWAGDAVYEIKIAGTNFHAGMLTIVELPPNVHPNDLAGTRDYSAYNWRGIDAKNPDLEGFSVRDVRQTAFHYIDDAANVGNHHIGGYLAIYVDMALNTSSTGTQQVSVQVWCKPAPNFRLLKLRIPRLRAQVRSSHLEELLNSMFDFTKGNSKTISVANLRRDAYYMAVRPKSEIEHSFGLMNCFSADGTPVSSITGVPQTHSYDRRDRCEIVWHDTDASGPNNSQFRYQVRFQPGWRMDKQNNAGALFVHTTGICPTLIKQDPQNPVKGKKFEPTFTVQADTGSAKQIEMLINSSSNFAEYIIGEKASDFWSEPTPFSTNAEESWITFYGKENTSLQGYMPDEVASAFSKGYYRDWFPAGQAASFIMSSDDVPIGTAKLYRSGKLVTKGSKDEVRYDVNKMRLVFDGFINESQSIAANKQHSYNRLLVLPHHSYYSSSQ